MTHLIEAPLGARPAAAARPEPALVRGLAWLVLGLVSGWALWDVIARAWVCDDAFISFRYAWQLLQGNGLVYNAEERVEGYTNFLWTMMLAGGMALGADPVPLSQVLGILCWLGTIAVLLVASRNLGREAGARPSFLPVAALGVLMHHDLRGFATCGLETSMFVLLATALLVRVIEARTLRGWLVAGLLGTLAAMTRPDGVLLYALAGGFALADGIRTRDWRVPLAAALPALLVYLPYFLWRWSYYGWLFPNTFYAKSGGASWWDQGLYYLGLYFACYWLLVVGGVVAGHRAVTARGLSPGWVSRRAPLAVLAFATCYLVYVAKVGGDFMFGRFCLPVTPALLLGFELLRVALRRSWPAALALLFGVGVACFASVRPDWTKGLDLHGIHDEETSYRPEYTRLMRTAGARLKEVFAGSDVRILVGGTLAMLAYFGEFTFVLEGASGLTDEHLAHLPIGTRGRPGHEKPWTIDPPYVASRKIDLHPFLDPLNLAAQDRIGPRRRVKFGTVPGVPGLGTGTIDITGKILIYRREIWDRLRGRPDVEFEPFDRFLDEYLLSIDQRPRAELEKDYEAFRGFYFAHNRDPEREQPFRERLGR